MNTIQLHLALNHFPVIVTLIAVSVIILGFFFKNPAVVRTGLYLGVVSALFSIPAYLTGEPAEHLLKEFMAVTKGVIHAHEEFAETSFIVLIVTGVFCIASLFTEYKKHALQKALNWVSLAGLLVSVGLMGWTAHLGGLIRHEELREGATSLLTEPVTQTVTQPE